MRIALVTDGIFPYVIGGMQKHSYYLCKYLVRLGVEIDLYHTNLSKFDIHQLELFTPEEKSKINSIVIKFPESDKMPGHYLRSSYKYSLAVYDAFMKREKVDFIYCKGFSGWKLAQEKKSNKLQIPLAVNFHGYEMFQPAPSFKSKIEQILLFRGPVKFICNHADFVFSYGSKINDVIKSIPIPNSKIVAIPTGIEAEWLNDHIKPTDNTKKFLFIGRYERRKGIQELSSALSNLKLMNAEFHFIGPIPEQNKVIKDNIIYHGAIHNQEEIKKITRSCDILLCPSYSEGMPNVIMEGMASGLAIIATNVGAVNLLVDKNNGYLLELKELNNLQQIIDEFSSKSAKEIDDMKSSSKNKIKENFLWTHIAQLHLDFFVSSIKNKFNGNNA
ncbi:MAG TPA: glycosyltransferase family 4 protein [Bacteroidia bacterium]|nr:glycosyltransferase family 4 protein [Bacteroidia bacterium]